MLRLVLYLSIISFLTGCQLLDNSVNGQYGSSAPTGATGLKINLANCSNAPPEALSYSCSLVSEIVYSQGDSPGAQKVTLNSPISFSLVSNTCTGLSMDDMGRLEGVIEKTVTETCSYAVRATTKDFTVEEILILTIAPSLNFSFSSENIFIQEGAGVTSFDLILSAPAPFDTFVEFEIYGQTTEVLSGISFATKRIEILQGQDRVTLDLSVDSGISQVVYQQLRLKSGSVNQLPGVSINSYESTVNPRSFEQISAGTTHTCGIDDGKLFCWGGDQSGQLGNGNGSTEDVATALQIGISTLWQSVAAGADHSCGIDDGKLFCWGGNYYGQQGNASGSTASVTAPAQIGASSSWQSLTTGHFHTCGIDGGKLFCWGRNDNGQVGDGSGSSASVTAPVQVGLSALWGNLAAGYNHTCGIDDNKLFCWGGDGFGQLGNGSGSSASVSAPIQIGLSSLWEGLAAGRSHTCGIDDGKLFCWGKNEYGQVGDGSGSSANVTAPVQVGLSSLWEDLAAGTNHTCGIDNNKLFCWGRDGFGQLGNGSMSSADITTPVQVGASSLWQNITAGAFHTCGIDNSKLFCWGRDSNGQVGTGIGSNTVLTIPTQVGASLLWESLAAGAFHTCGIHDGKLFCWGRNTYGQVGSGNESLADVTNPTQVGTSSLWQNITAGTYHTCGIDNGSLFCWGKDDFGQLGNGSLSSADVTTPVQVGSSSLWQNLTAGNRHTCGINDGRLFCWGRDSNGQTGNGSGSSTDVTTPEQIGASLLWQSLAAGSFASCGINEGKLFCWGQGISGDVVTPTQIGVSSVWQSLAIGAFHTCGIDDGKLFCWGLDSSGQLGNGSGSSAIVITPTQIGTSSLWQSLAAGYNHTCGLDDGKLFCWGSDSISKLGNGNGSSADITAPEQIGVSSLWQSVTAGDAHTCGLDDGKLFCWGSDSNGQTGQSSALLGSPFLVIE